MSQPHPLYPTYARPRYPYMGHLRVSDEHEKSPLVLVAPESKHPSTVPVKDHIIGMRYRKNSVITNSPGLVVQQFSVL